MKTSKTWAAGLAASLLLIAGPARGQEKPADKPADKPVEQAADKPKPAIVKVAAGPEGFSLQSESGDFKIQLRGLVQFDARFYPGDSVKLAIDSFLLRRARPIVTGSLGKYFEFNLTPDFGGVTPLIQDAYGDIKFKPAARARVGKFKPPIGIEHLQSDPVLPFIERATPSSLVPNRDIGVQLSGDLAGGVVSYAVGVFNGTLDGNSIDVDLNDGKDVVGRVLLTPFKKSKSALSGLSLGVGASDGTQLGLSPTYRTGGQLPFFSYIAGVVADGDRSRISPELSYFSGRVSLVGEYASSKTELRQTATADRHKIQAEAWEGTVGFFLTGDTVSFGGVKVKKPLDPSKGQWGGLQLVARVNALEVDQDAFTLGLADITKSARKASAWGVGLNWYLNNNLKQAVSYERTTFTGGAATGDRPNENALFVRTQVSF